RAIRIDEKLRGAVGSEMDRTVRRLPLGLVKVIPNVHIQGNGKDVSTYSSYSLNDLQRRHVAGINRRRRRRLQFLGREAENGAEEERHGTVQDVIAARDDRNAIRETTG